MERALIRNAVVCALVAWPATAFQNTACVNYLKSTIPGGENAKLLRLEALAGSDSSYAVTQVPGLETITGSRLEPLGRRLIIKRQLGLDYSIELYQLDLWYSKRQGHDSLFRTNTRDLANYVRAMSTLGRNTDGPASELVGKQNQDGSWSDKTGRAGSALLTAMVLQALRGSSAFPLYSDAFKKGIQSLTLGFATHASGSRADLLFNLEVAGVLHDQDAYRSEFDTQWGRVESRQLADGSIAGDAELTAKALLIYDRLPGNLGLAPLALVDAAGRNISEALVGQTMRIRAKFSARLADFSDSIRIRFSLQPNESGALRTIDTTVRANLVKGATQDFILNLGNADSLGTYRLDGSFAYLSMEDSVHTIIPATFIRATPASELRFAGDSLRIVPDSAGPGDTVSIRVTFMNSGRTISTPFRVACLVKHTGGSFDTLGYQTFTRAPSGVPITFSFLSGFPANGYTARLILDAGDSISESNEDNNVLDRNFTVVARPDLAFSSSLDASCAPAGDSAACQATFKVANKGTDSTGAFKLRLAVFSGTTSINSLDSLLANLNAGSEQVVLMEFTLPDSLSSTNSSFLVSAILDPQDSLAESNEGNNRSDKALDYSSGLNFTVKENTEEPEPIFVVQGLPVHEHFNICAQKLPAMDTLHVRMLVLRDSLVTYLQLDTNLVFPQGTSARPLAFSWTPDDSAQQFQVKVILDPADSIAEVNETDNLLVIKRVMTGFHARLLSGPAEIDSAGQMVLRIQAKDYLGKPIPGLVKNDFSLSKSGTRSDAFDVVPLQNTHTAENRIDIVLIEVHEPASLYRTRLLYRQLMPELQSEFARMGYSLNFDFRIPYYKEQTAEGAVHGNAPQGIFNGEVRNLLDEPDHTYKWAPAATYQATYYPWRQNALKIILPMFDFLGQGEEFNPEDPVVPNSSDSSDYHIEFADSCLHRGIQPYLLVANWGWGELNQGQTNSITAIAGGSVHFPGTKARMKAELKQFIAERIANYELHADSRDLGFALSEGDALATGLDYHGNTVQDTAFVTLTKKLDLDVELALASSEVRNDSLIVRALLKNRSTSFISQADAEVVEKKGGAEISRYRIPGGSLDALSQKTLTIAVPMTADSVLYIFRSTGAYSDVIAENDADSVAMNCSRCPYPDLSLYSDSLQAVSSLSSGALDVSFRIPWHDRIGGPVDIAVKDDAGHLLYHGEASSTPGFNHADVTVGSASSLAGKNVSVILSYTEKADRNPRDNAKTYVLEVQSGPITAYFRGLSELLRLQAGPESTQVDFVSEITHAVDTSISILARNLADSSLVTVLRSAAPTHIDSGTEAGREAFVDVSLRDTLGGKRYGEYLFRTQDIVAALDLPSGSRVNAGSFKLYQTSGTGAGNSLPIIVTATRSGQELTGYRIQWAIRGAHLDSAYRHRLYFSFDPNREFDDRNYVGDEIYSLNNFGDLYRMRAFNGAPGYPVFVQKFGGADSLRYMRLGVGDMNEDGYEDIIYSDKNALMIRYGDSTGGFGAANLLKNTWTQSYYYPHDALAVTEPIIGDFNGDGHLDILATPLGGDMVTMLGNGMGTYSIGPYAYCYNSWASPGDVFRPSGKSHDLMAKSYGSVLDAWEYPNGCMMLAHPPTYDYHGYGGMGGYPGSNVAANAAVVADIDNDGFEDLISMHLWNEWGVLFNDSLDRFSTRYDVPPIIAYWHGTGSGYFTPQLGVQGNGLENKVYGYIPSVSGWTEIGSMDNTDYDGDGYQDFVLTESSVPYRTMVYKGHGDFTFDPPQVLGYDSVGVWGMQVAYKRIIKATGGVPGINRPAGNTLAWAWEPDSLGPGQFVLEAWQHNSASDSERIGLSNPFRVLPALRLAVSVSPQQSVFQAGRDFAATISLSDTASYPASGLTVRILSKVPTGTTELLRQENLYIGALNSVSFPVRATARDSQSILILVEQEGHEDTTSYAVPVASGQAYVKGAISLGDYDGIEVFRVGRSLTFTLTAANLGNGDAMSNLLLLSQRLGFSPVDTLFQEVDTLRPADSMSRTASHLFDSAGTYRLTWLNVGASDTLALDSRLIRFTGSLAPQIVRIVPKAGSVVSAGTLVDIWLDTLAGISSVSTTQGILNRAAALRTRSLGYVLYRDTIQSYAGSLLSYSVSAVDGDGQGPTSSTEDANPALITYPYSSDPQPFMVSGVQDGRVYASDLNISARADSNLIRFPAILLDSQAWAGGIVSAEGDHSIRLSGIRADSTSYLRIIRFAVDKTGPDIEIDNIKDGDVFGRSITPVIRALDPHGSSLIVYLDGKAWTPSQVGSGSHFLAVSAVDSLGNASATSLGFTVDVGTDKYARLNPPIDGAQYNRTVYPGIESNLDDILEQRIGIKTPVSLDSTVWSVLKDTLKVDSIFDWAAGPSIGDSWRRLTDTSYFGFSPDGHYYSAGIRTDSMASWAAESGGADRGGEAAFPESLLVVSTDSGLYLFNSHTRAFWMRFRIDYGASQARQIHRPLYNLQFQDGNLAGFWDSGFVAISFQKDRTVGWNRGISPIRYAYSWNGIANRNAAVTATKIYLGSYSWFDVAFHDMRAIRMSVGHFQRAQFVELNSNESVFQIKYIGPATPAIYSNNPNPNIYCATSNGKSYRLRAHSQTGSPLIDTLGRGANGYDYQPITGGLNPEFAHLAPDVHLNRILKLFGYNGPQSSLSSLGFLLPEYLQTTSYNRLDRDASPGKRVLKIGAPPALPIKSNGGFDSSSWRVDSGTVRLAHGFIEADTSMAASRQERLRLVEKASHTSDFVAEYTIVSYLPARKNAYVRIAFRDTLGVEQITGYAGAFVYTHWFYGNSLTIDPDYITSGYQVGSRTESSFKTGLWSGKNGSVSYRIRIEKKDQTARLYYWDFDKWSEILTAPAEYTYKGALRMEMSIVCLSGNPAFGIRLDKYEETNTYYLPPTVARLADAFPDAAGGVLLRTVQKDSTVRFFSFDTTTKAIEPVSDPFNEYGGQRILALASGRYLTQSDSDFAVRNRLPVDPITPIDSVSAEGNHELLARIVSRKYGTFYDTSAFVIDKTIPQIAISGISPGTLYNDPVTIAYSISDAHLDSSRTAATLNGVVPAALTVSRTGNYVFRVKAIDSAGNVADTAISFSIAPNFRLTGVTTQLIIDEDMPDSSLNVVSLFNPGSGLTYSVTSPPNLAAALTSSNKLYLQPAPDFSGIRDVVIQAMLSGVPLEDTLRVIVRPANDPPYLISADTISGTGGQPVSYRIQVGDVDNVPTFSTSGQPSWLARNGDFLSGTAPVYGSSTQFTLSMSDGDTTVNKTIQIRITNVNTPPVIAPAVEAEPAASGDTVFLNLAGNLQDDEDPDSSLVWTWGNSLYATVVAGASKDLWKIAPASGFNDTVSLRLILADPGGAADTQYVLLDWTQDSGPVHTYLKAWFPFKERVGDSTRDSLSANVFALASSSMWSADTGLTFRTVSAASNASSLTLNPARGLSFEFWLKSDSLIAASEDLLTFTRTSSPTTPAWAIRLVRDTLRVYESNTTSNRTLDFPSAVSKKNAWHHMVVSLASDSVALFRNGIQLGRVSGTALNTSPVAVIPSLGGAASAGGNTAELALLRIYERKFSAYKALYNFSKTERQEGLKAFVEAEHYSRRLGSNFPFNVVPSLPSDTAMAIDDTPTEQCFLYPMDSSYVQFTVNAPQTGTYYLFGRSLGKVYDNSFWVQVDAGVPWSWHVSFGNIWKTEWVKGPVDITPTSVSLSAGTHTIRIYTREPGTLLDWVGMSSKNDLLLPFVENPTYFTAP